jgi:hypothetical protein
MRALGVVRAATPPVLCASFTLLQRCCYAIAVMRKAHIFERNQPLKCRISFAIFFIDIANRPMAARACNQPMHEKSADTAYPNIVSGETLVRPFRLGLTLILYRPQSRGRALACPRFATSPDMHSGYYFAAAAAGAAKPHCPCSILICLVIRRAFCA